MINVFKNDLLLQTPSSIVEKTIGKLSEHYKVQANPREINLFYLKDDIRERIVKTNNEWRVTGTDIHFSEKELLQELEQYPERFSPNVILRGLFQETILPNIAFIGGGGEIAYWLELKELFVHYKVPFPVLVIRNSFLLIEKKWQEKIAKLGFELKDLFKEENRLIENLVKRNSAAQLSLAKEIKDLHTLYNRIKDIAGKIDSSLSQHTENLETKAANKLQRLEKKMLKAEKKKFDSAQHQLHVVKEALFPKGNLQERTDNFIPYYAKWGKEFIKAIYEHSPALEQEFVILSL
jgi:bacillithiol biosynthesis cysteine-adding enzyme BshC